MRHEDEVRIVLTGPGPNPRDAASEVETRRLFGVGVRERPGVAPAVTRIGLGGVAALSLALGCGSDGGESAASGPGADAAFADATDGSGVGSGCEFGEIAGGCAPRPPHGTLLDDCPGGVLAGEDDFFVGGVCMPHLPDWDCAQGWRPAPGFTDDEGNDDPPEGMAQFTVCQPGTPPDDCPPGWMPRIGESDCVRHGIECPPGDQIWHDEAAIRAQAPDHDGPIAYVSPDGDDDGDGSRRAPFVRIGQAIVEAGDGGIVALASGTYAQRMIIASRIAVVGSCVEATTIAAPGDDDVVATVTFSGNSANGQLSAVTVTGDRPGIVFRDTQRPNLVARVAVSSSTVVGVNVTGPQRDVTFEDPVIRDTRADPAGGFGRGLNVQDGASVDARSLFVAGNREVGVAVSGAGASLTLRDALIHDTRERAGNRWGALGLRARQGASVDVRSLVISDSRGGGILASDADTAVTLRDVVVRDTRPQPSDDGFGRGVDVADGAFLDARSLVVTRSRSMGVSARGAGSTVVLRGAVVRGTLPRASDRAFGRGVQVADGASFDGTALVVSGNRESGIVASGPQTVLTLSDVVVRRTLPRESDDKGGRGLSIEDGAALDGRSVFLVENRDNAVAAIGAGTSAALRDLHARDTRERTADREGGHGVGVGWGASLEVDSSLVAESRAVGVVVVGTDTSLTLRDAVVRDTRAEVGTGMFGRGLDVSEGASVEASSLLVSGSRDVGVFAVTSDTSVSLRETVIRDTQVTACSESDPDACGAGGSGVVVRDGATIDLEGFAIDSCALAGIQIAFDGDLTVRSGVLTRNAVGLNVQVPGFEVDTAFEDVRLVDNLRDIATDDLPVPGAADLLAGTGL